MKSLTGRVSRKGEAVPTLTHTGSMPGVCHRGLPCPRFFFPRCICGPLPSVDGVNSGVSLSVIHTESYVAPFPNSRVSSFP